MCLTGYAGRAELPENLKALFRPCAMVVPDFELICEIMLVAEGFLDARLLARKFITLYTLCRELLSKQDHYDWGLRAIKSVLVVAGALKRSDPDRPEDQVGWCTLLITLIYQLSCLVTLKNNQCFTFFCIFYTSFCTFYTSFCTFYTSFFSLKQ